MAIPDEAPGMDAKWAWSIAPGVAWPWSAEG
jgi:hypothetical protein